MSREKTLTWLARFLLALWAGCYLTAASIIVVGGRWEYIVTVGNPKDPLVYGTLAFLLWQAVLTARRRAPGRWKTFSANMLLLAVSVSLSLYGAERGLRTWLRSSQGFSSLEALDSYSDGRYGKIRDSHALAHIVRLSTNKSLVYELKPRVDMNFGGRRLKTNSAGMRESREYNTAKPPGAIRIVGVGDSGMWGWAMHQGDTYMDLLEESLGKREGTFEALNLAVPGYSTYQEVETVAAKGLAYDPDIVIVSWCVNDFSTPFFLFTRNEHREKDVSYFYNLLFDRRKFASLAAPQVRKGSQIEKGYMDPGVLENTGEDGVRRSLARLKEMGKREGFHIVVAGPMYHEIVDILKELDIPFMNFYKTMPANRYPKEYAIHFMHPREGGHRVIAEHLEKYLDEQGWLDVSP